MRVGGTGHRRGCLAIVGLTLAAAWLSTAGGAGAAILPPTPIKKVMFIYQENHSFDEVLGQLCIQDARCDSVSVGKLPGGTPIPLAKAKDFVPSVAHSTTAQLKAINGGQMDGFAKIDGCKAEQSYRCYVQYQPSQIPNLAKLARQYALSDRTFQMDSVPTFGAHIEVVAATLNGFVGDAPGAGAFGNESQGWGCDSWRDARWRSSPSAKVTRVPSCIPDPRLALPFGGAYRSSPVKYVPTIMNRLQSRGLSWKLYAPTGNGYSWAICPYFAECLYTSMRNNSVPHDRVLQDAAAGKLPNFSVVIPTPGISQHNNYSMIKGDNWIAKIVSAVQSSADWKRSAIFIFYDDCGCFYDHVPPPAGLGIRIPMVIVSPYARPGYTDSNVASIASPLAFTEHVFGLPPLTGADANAYDYADSFDFDQPPLQPLSLRLHQVPKQTHELMRKYPADPNDPT